MDHALARRNMVDEQLIPRGIRDPGVLKAMCKVERHRFIPGDSTESAYRDGPVAIGRNQTISQPYMVALMTEALALTGTERILEIGTGSGYQTAILAELAGRIYTIERIPELSGQAEALLTGLGYANISFARGDGSLGWKDEAPFDRVLVTAACPRIPLPLAEQLREGGTIVAPVGSMGGHQALTRSRKVNGELLTETICDCVFVPLIGEFGMEKTGTDTP